MDHKEFRIGNYVTGISGDVCTIESISSILNEDNEIVKYRIDLYSIDTVMREFNSIPKPITLNEEWLLKFGFIYSEIQERYLLKVQKETWICWSKTEGYTLQNVSSIILKFKKLKYVHQLQNLHYSITQEEIKLEQS